MKETMKLINGINYKLCAAAVIAAVLSYFFADITVTLFFSHMKDGDLYNFFRMITLLGKAEYTIVPALIVYLFTRKSRPTIAKTALAVGFSVALAGLSTDVIKFFVGRMRPVLFLEQGLYGFVPLRFKYEYISMPSGHTADIFGACCLLIIRYRRYVPALLAVALIVGMSRVITLHHFVSDVVIGAVVGYVSAQIVYNKMFLGRDNEKTA